MPKYLIDNNLPYYFSVWRGPDFVNQFDLDDERPDEEIWDYARQHRMTIVTKDSDFSDRILVSEPPPRIVHVCIGNLKMRPFFELISRCWPEVCQLSDEYKLVRVFRDRIEAID